MKARDFFMLALVGALAAVLWAAPQAQAQATPRALRGKIITNAHPIQLPSKLKGFVAKMRRQDRNVFKRGDEGTWTIHFVAFFNRPLPADKLGVVVLDAKKEPVAVADVSGQKGQKTLASEILVETTETRGKKHTLQVYFARGNKPVVLAKKQIVLK